MNRDEFMKRVEYLISDLPEEETRDALDYYRDYLEEAGDAAEEAMREFGSPERIASIIRTDIQGNLADGGEFTDTGYTDERFREPNCQRIHKGRRDPRRGHRDARYQKYQRQDRRQKYKYEQQHHDRRQDPESAAGESKERRQNRDHADHRQNDPEHLRRRSGSAPPWTSRAAGLSAAGAVSISAIAVLTLILPV